MQSWGSRNLEHVFFCRRKLWRTVEEDFPESDIVATVYTGEITYTLDDFEKIEGLIADFERYQAETDFLEDAAVLVELIGAVDDEAGDEE